jgi:uncharacterized delta-60 repeat protein
LEQRTVFAVGALDPSFGDEGLARASLDLGGRFGDWAEAIAVDTRGRTVVVGFSQRSGGNLDFSVARFLDDGRLDPAFGSAGTATIAFDLGGNRRDQAHAVAIDSRGRVVVVGQAEVGGADAHEFAVVRLLPNGRLDRSFSRDGKTTFRINDATSVRSADSAYDVAISTGDRIIVVGKASPSGLEQGSVFGVARLTAAGALDRSFGVAGRVVFDFPANPAVSTPDIATGVAIDRQGRIVVVGSVGRETQDDTDFGVIRLTTNGAMDRTFGFPTLGYTTVSFGAEDRFGAGSLDRAADVAIDGVGRIVVVGNVQDQAAVVRLSTDGQLDPQFNGDGKLIFSFGDSLDQRSLAASVALDASGLIYVAGSVQTGGSAEDRSAFGVARIGPSGAFDRRFQGDGTTIIRFDPGSALVDRASAVAIDRRGRILVGGSVQRAGSATFDFGVARLLR